MGRRRRLLGPVALVAVGAGLVSGCGQLFDSTFEDDTVLAEAITSVRVENSNGGVTLRGDGAATEVSVHRKVSHHGSRPEQPSHRVEDGVLILAGCGARCTVEYTVDLPAGLPVGGETSNGDLRLSRMGEVDVRTENGSVELDGATGAVAVQTDNGKVELVLDTPQDVRAATDNGGITVTVPDGTYQVTAHTDNGDTDIQVVDDPAGTHRIDLSTGNGPITLRPA